MDNVANHYNLILPDSRDVLLAEVVECVLSDIGEDFCILVPEILL